MSSEQFWGELSHWHWGWGVELPSTYDGERRYVWYRRKGLAPDPARLAALAWERNTREQRERRVGHGTGAT